MLTVAEVVKEIRSTDEDVKAIAVFLDSTHAYQFAILRESVGISIDCFNEQGEKTAFLDLAIETEERIRLTQIYCFSPFRKRKIATYLWELAECYLQTRIGVVVYGVFEPFQNHTDQERYHHNDSQKELYKQARNFYLANGFQFTSDTKEKGKETDYYSVLGYPKETPSSYVFRKIKPKDRVPYVMVEEDFFVHEDVKNCWNDSLKSQKSFLKSKK